MAGRAKLGKSLIGKSLLAAQDFHLRPRINR